MNTDLDPQPAPFNRRKFGLPRDRELASHSIEGGARMKAFGRLTVLLMIFLGLAGVYQGVQGDATTVEYTSVGAGEIVKVIGQKDDEGCHVRVRYAVGETKYLGTFPCSQLKGVIAEGMEPAVYYDEENPRIATLQSNASKSRDALKPFLGAAILITCGLWTWRRLNDGDHLRGSARH